MRPNRIHIVLIFLCGIVFLAPVINADMIIPQISYVYFEKDGIPYNGTVNYTVTCYGYTSSPYKPETRVPGSYQPQPFFRYSADYSGYGTPVYQQAYLQYTHVDWCDLEGVADNRNFTIRNFSTNPFSRCDYVAGMASRNFGGLQKYYYTTSEYVSCRYFEQKTAGQWTAYSYNFSKINSLTRFTTVLQLPGRNLLYGILPTQSVSINRSDIDMSLEHYIAYLETCRVNTDPACPGWIADGIPLKSYNDYRSLKKNATYMKEHPCDTFLLEADPSLILPVIADFSLLNHPCINGEGDSVPCNLTGRICESRFTIPSTDDSGNTGIKTIPGEPEPVGRTNLYRSPVESLFCSVLSRFNISCEDV